MNVKKITFENKPEIKQYLLHLLGKEVKDSYIIDSNSGKRVLSLNGEEVKFKEFAGIRKGSEIIFKSDIGSLIDYFQKYRV